jgi:hypothetical protein
MRSYILVGAFALSIAGCQAKTGNGAWDVKLGGEAKLISADGKDITLETFDSPARAPTDRRSKPTSTAKRITLPAGTSVVVLAIDGDDARVEIRDGSNAGSIYWVECSRLEPAGR